MAEKFYDDIKFYRFIKSPPTLFFKKNLNIKNIFFKNSAIFFFFFQIIYFFCLITKIEVCKFVLNEYIF